MNFQNRIIPLIISVLCMCNLQVTAQTNVVKVSAIKSNNYGIQYFLPKTILEIEVEYHKTERKAGVYAKYASKYLGLNEQSVISEDLTDYALDKIYVKDLSAPNKNESYLVEFKVKTTAPFVYLTENGLICTINADYPQPVINENKTETKNATSSVSTINPQSVYTKEYMQAGSVSKMAEIAAQQIYKIRESRSDILTGEAENAPKDGEALKIVLANLEAQEKVWTELFTGTSMTEKKTDKFQLEPISDLSKEILFRFSKHTGIVAADDLSGEPVYINISDLKTVDTEEIEPKRKGKESQGIVYNVPGTASVEVFYSSNRMYKGEHLITQFGITRILANSLFEDKKLPVQIIFYPNTGAIKQIIQ
ncbi:MAG: DUF4831 family protein [Dysgonamonadaceae bacterium]|jgi:hypothetical protein|nr:DUF4831 family protein [Dysgonamonadaceae bacterium]